jgi:hypothetical protein
MGYGNDCSGKRILLSLQFFLANPKIALWTMRVRNTACGNVKYEPRTSLFSRRYRRACSSEQKNTAFFQNPSMILGLFGSIIFSGAKTTGLVPFSLTVNFSSLSISIRIG